MTRFSEATNLCLLQGYGLTEAFVVCANPRPGDTARPETLGLVVDLKEVESALLDLLPVGARVRLSPLPMPRWGHQLAAHISCPRPAPTVDELKAQLAQRLSFFKIPNPLTMVTK